MCGTMCDAVLWLWLCGWSARIAARDPPLPPLGSGVGTVLVSCGCVNIELVEFVGVFGEFGARLARFPVLLSMYYRYSDTIAILPKFR